MRPSTVLFALLAPSLTLCAPACTATGEPRDDRDLQALPAAAPHAGSSPAIAPGDAGVGRTDVATVDDGGIDEVPPVHADSGAQTTATACEDVDVAAASFTLSQSLWGSIRFGGIVRVTTQVYVSEASVTIEPGTTFVMDADAGITFGDTGTTTVMALGTQAAPIHFCARVPTPGYWGSVKLGPQVTSDSVLEHVVVSHGGGDGAALQLQSAVRLSSVRVEASSGAGVVARDFSPGSVDLSIRDAGGPAVILTAADALDDFPLGGELRGNADDTIRLRFSDITGDTVVKVAGIPYLQEQAVDVHGVTLRFEPGVEYRFAADAFLNIGWNNSATTLQVDGELERPVVFRGAQATRAYWRGILVSSSVTSDSRVRHAWIRHAGGLDTPALRVDARITLDHVTLESNEIGARFDSALQPASTVLTITDTGGVPLSVAPEALTSIPEGGTFTGNESDEVVVDDAVEVHAVAGTIPSLGVPYHVASSIRLDQGSDVRIAAGAEFVMSGQAMIEVAWSSATARLLALGTTADPIVFRGEQDTAGYWPGIQFGAGTTGDSALAYVTIANAGRAGRQAIDLYRPVSVTNCTIRDSAGAGIQKQASDSSDYEQSNTFVNVAQGNVVTP